MQLRELLLLGMQFSGELRASGVSRQSRENKGLLFLFSCLLLDCLFDFFCKRFARLFSQLLLLSPVWFVRRVFSYWAVGS